MKNPASAPKHLRPESAEWWRSVVDAYAPEDQDLHLLTLACEALDRAAEARDSLAENGTVYNDRFGQPKARPEVAIERDSRAAFARLVRQLGFDDVGPEKDGRSAPQIGKPGGKR